MAMSDTAALAPQGGGGGGGSGRIGDKLVALGLITEDQLQVAIYEKGRSGKMLGNVLVDLGFITEGDLTAILSQSSGVQTFNAAGTLIDPEVVKLVPKDVASRFRVLPVALSDEEATVAMVDPYDVIAMDQLRRFFPRGVEIVPQICTTNELMDAIERAYGFDVSIDGIIQELRTGEIDMAAAMDPNAGYSHPIIRLINALMLDAVKMGASDIHFEPEALFVRLRYRVDGSLVQVRAFHKDDWPIMLQRLKILSGINIADKQNPQDGRLSMNVAGRPIDFRVSTLPTIHGENVVLRILDKTRALVSLDGLGFSQYVRNQITRVLQRPEGIIIVTGPTGAGKTTTLYSMLSLINKVDINIMTVEDPVEYELHMIRQSQVREGTGVTFSESLRAILRQDPDVVFVGEVRDQETAEMALQAAMTGHQVFATLHTNDAIGAIPRLLHLGVNPGIMSGNIIASMAQRLVKKLCVNCKMAYTASEDDCRILGADLASPPQIYAPVGCSECRDTGYKGRMAISEILIMDEELDDVVARGGSRTEIKNTAVRKGFRSIAEDGIEKVLEGEISIASLIRAVDLTARI